MKGWIGYSTENGYLANSMVSPGHIVPDFHLPELEPRN